MGYKRESMYAMYSLNFNVGEKKKTEKVHSLFGCEVITRRNPILLRFGGVAILRPSCCLPVPDFPRNRRQNHSDSEAKHTESGDKWITIAGL